MSFLLSVEPACVMENDAPGGETSYKLYYHKNPEYWILIYKEDYHGKYIVYRYSGADDFLY